MLTPQGAVRDVGFPAVKEASAGYAPLSKLSPALRLRFHLLGQTRDGDSLLEHLVWNPREREVVAAKLDRLTDYVDDFFAYAQIDAELNVACVKVSDLVHAGKMLWFDFVLSQESVDKSPIWLLHNITLLSPIDRGLICTQDPRQLLTGTRSAPGDPDEHEGNTEGEGGERDEYLGEEDDYWGAASDDNDGEDDANAGVPHQREEGESATVMTSSSVKQQTISALEHVLRLGLAAGMTKEELESASQAALGRV
ncbi:hypothetical protein PYCC9005_003219 [Savitreella phatthalungensis]